MGGKPITPPPHAHAFATADASATSAANTGTSVANALTSGLGRRRKSQRPPRDSDTAKSDSGTDNAKQPPGNGTRLVHNPVTPVTFTDGPMTHFPHGFT